MPTRQEIDKSLKRKIKPGKEYDKLIPSATCETTSLGLGDTFHTVETIQKWVLQHSWQTAGIAPLLVGRSLEETIQKIWKFQYEHIQYKIGGAVQYISSPACTWANRKIGVECKSFSVFSSSILTNLGIKHYIRQIKQPDFQPESFSHVYVVVPVDQSLTKHDKDAATLVLDSSKPWNIESTYSTKSDIPMMLEHIGLNSSAVAVNEAAQQIIEAFDRFCQKLLDNGVPPETIYNFRLEVLKYTSKGLDPRIKITPQYLSVQGKKFYFNIPGLQAGAQGEGEGFNWSKIVDFFKDFSFSNLLTSSIYCNLTNTSYNPEKGKADAEKDLPFLLSKSGLTATNAVNSVNFNNFANLIGGYLLDATKGATGDLAKCTKEGHKVRMDMTKAYFEHIKSKMIAAGYQIQKTGSKPGGFALYLPGYAKGKQFTVGTSTSSATWQYTYDTYNVVAPAVEPENPLESSGGDTTGGNSTGGTSIPPKKGIQTSAGSTGKILLGTGVTAAAIFFVPKMMKQFNAAQAEVKSKNQEK